MKRVFAMLVVLAALVAVAAGSSAKPLPNTISLSPSTVQDGDYFSVSGCAFDVSLGNVIVGFTGGSWGSPLDANGCFTISSIPALSGDTLPAGTYPVTASQYVHNKWTVVAESDLTVVP